MAVVFFFLFLFLVYFLDVVCECVPTVISRVQRTTSGVGDRPSRHNVRTTTTVAHPACGHKGSIYPSLPGSRLRVFLAMQVQSTPTPRQLMVELFVLASSRFPLRKPEQKFTPAESRTHKFRLGRKLYPLVHGGSPWLGRSLETTRGMGKVVACWFAPSAIIFTPTSFYRPYEFLSRCSYSTPTPHQPMIKFFQLMSSRFPLRKPEKKCTPAESRTHKFRLSRRTSYLQDHRTTAVLLRVPYSEVLLGNTCCTSKSHVKYTYNVPSFAAHTSSSRLVVLCPENIEGCWWWKLG